MKTQDLTGPALDWAVAKCEGKNGVLHGEGCIVIAAPSGVYKGIWRPTVNWAQGGPIIEREGITVQRVTDALWDAYCQRIHRTDGPTPLIAAMRCYVASHLGAEVEVPEEMK